MSKIKLSQAAINNILEGYNRPGYQTPTKDFTQDLIRTLKKAGQHKEAAKVFKKEFQQSSSVFRDTTAKKLGINLDEKSMKPEKKVVKTEKKSSRKASSKLTQAQKRASELAKEAKKITKTSTASQSKPKPKPQSQSKSKPKPAQAAKPQPKPQTTSTLKPVKGAGKAPNIQSLLDDAWVKKSAQLQKQAERKAVKDAAEKAARKAGETSTKVKPTNIVSRVLKGFTAKTALKTTGILGTAYALLDPTELNKGEPRKAVWSAEEKAKIYATTNVSQAKPAPMVPTTKPAPTKSTTAKDDWNRLKATLKKLSTSLKTKSAASTNRNSTNIPVRAADTLDKLGHSAQSRGSQEERASGLTYDPTSKPPSSSIKRQKSDELQETTSSKSGGGWLNQAIANALNVPVTPGTEIDDPSTKSGTRTEYPAHQLNPVTSWPKSWNEDRKTAYIEKKMREKEARKEKRPFFNI